VKGKHTHKQTTLVRQFVPEIKPFCI